MVMSLIENILIGDEETESINQTIQVNKLQEFARSSTRTYC